MKSDLSTSRRLRDLEDKESWQIFFDLYWRLLYNVARRAGSRRRPTRRTSCRTP